MNTFARIEDVRASIKFFDWLLAGALACPIVAVTHDALWAECKPDHFKPPFFVKSKGVCAFDPETLSYAGTPVQQATCLMRGMDVSRNLIAALVEPTRSPRQPHRTNNRIAVARDTEQ